MGLHGCNRDSFTFALFFMAVLIHYSLGILSCRNFADIRNPKEPPYPFRRHVNYDARRKAAQIQNKRTQTSMT
jgi:hypothetical protein